MTWGRFEAHARAHAKCRKAGNEAASFWVWAILWSIDNKTDGYLDGSLLGDVMPNAIANEKAKVLADQCANAAIKPGGVGLFERADNGAFIVHDFHHFQPPSDEELREEWNALTLSEKRRLAGQKGAAARWQKEVAKLDSKTDDNPSRARASDRIGGDRVGSEALEGSPEGRDSATIPKFETVREAASRGYAEGIQAVTGSMSSFLVFENEVDIILEMIGATPQWRGLRGNGIANAIRKSAHDYALAHKGAGKFEKGFSPTKWAEWLRAGATAAETGPARPGPARAVQPAAETLFTPDEVHR